MPDKEDAEILNLVCEASDKADARICGDILAKALATPEVQMPSVVPHLELLLDTWGGTVENSSEKASFCLDLAQIKALDSSASMRNALVLAARHFAPAFLSKSEAVKLSMARDGKHPVNAVSGRIRKIARLADENLCAYLLNANEWIEKRSIDPITHLVEVFDIIALKKKSIPLDILISGSIFFRFSSHEILAMAGRGKALSFPDWRGFILSHAVVVPDDEQIRRLSLATFIPSRMSASEFTAWYGSGAHPTETSRKRLSEARSLEELHSGLAKAAKEKCKLKITKEDSGHISDMLSKSLGTDPSPERIRMLSDCFAFLAESGDDDSSRSNAIAAFASYASMLLPDDRTRRESLMEHWAEMPVSSLKSLLGAIRAMKGEDFLAGLSLDLPTKALSCIGGILDETRMIEALKSSRAKPHADMVLWGWRNRKIPDVLDTVLSPARIFSAIAEKTVLKFRNAAIRELKRMLLSDDKFIALLADHGADSAEKLLMLIDDDKVLLPPEKQSLIVKLSRISPSFKRTIENAHESGSVKLSKTLSYSRRETVQLTTSIKSHKARVLELQDITTRQLPENAAAIANARSYGDLRENAEYSAAKERQKFLNRRKFEIERDLDNVAAVRFATDDGPEKTVRCGRSVVLRRDASGEETTYLVLGAWDGDPLKNRLSSESALAKSLMGKSEGERISIDGDDFTIRKVSFLPPETIAELNEE